ncbi:MAG: hypothetical protein SXU28_01980 [Pseudomonadota bacterium]|nr:hypothetical protein [Pseudomonadota bacterium]
MHRAAPLFALAAAIALNGCVARTAANIITAPVKVAGKAVDVATTSQSEADEKRGRDIRKREEELGKLERRYEKELKRCREGDQRSCEDARMTYLDMQKIIPTIPAEPDD